MTRVTKDLHKRNVRAKLHIQRLLCFCMVAFCFTKGIASIVVAFSINYEAGRLAGDVLLLGAIAGLSIYHYFRTV